MRQKLVLFTNRELVQFSYVNQFCSGTTEPNTLKRTNTFLPQHHYVSLDMTQYNNRPAKKGKILDHFTAAVRA